MTYTFSRALHMMRYGGAKMRWERWRKDNYLKVDENGMLYETITDGEEWFDTILSSVQLMGNWIEVKDKE